MPAYNFNNNQYYAKHKTICKYVIDNFIVILKIYNSLIRINK